MNEGLVLAARSTDVSNPGVETDPLSGTQTSLTGMGGSVIGMEAVGAHSLAPFGALISEGEVWEQWTPTTVLPYALVSFEDLEITPVHISSRLGLLSEVLEVALASVTEDMGRIRTLPTASREASTTNPRSLVAWLRDSAQFRVAEISDVLEVSRRTLYHWLEEGRVPPEQHVRLRLLTEAVRRLAGEWGPTRIKAWLASGDPSPVALLRTDERGQFERAVNEALTVGEIPRLQARRLSGSYEETMEEAIHPLDQAARLQAFHAFATTRRPVREVAWRPKELTDSDFEHEE
jgi:hypothetical protein